MRGRIRVWWRGRHTRRVPLSEVSALAGDSWGRVWRKLRIEPCRSGSVIIGELKIGNAYSIPIVASTGLPNRADIIASLHAHLPLSRAEIAEFVDCTKDYEYVVSAIERSMIAGEAS